MSDFSRRRLLGAGGVTVALPFLESLLPRSARAQATTAPRRVIWVFTANGDQESRRFSTKSETGFVLDEFLAHRREVIERRRLGQGLGDARPGHVHTRGAAVGQRERHRETAPAARVGDVIYRCGFENGGCVCGRQF